MPPRCRRCPARVFARRQPEPAGKLAGAPKGVRCGPPCRPARSPSTGQCPESCTAASTTGSASANTRSSRSSSATRVLDLPDFLMERSSALSQMTRQRRRRVFEDRRHGLQAPPVHPRAAAIPCSRKMPRSALMRAVRVVIHCSRTRCNGDERLLLHRLTGTVGDCARCAPPRGSLRHRSDLSYSGARRAGHTPAATSVTRWPCRCATRPQ